MTSDFFTKDDETITITERGLEWLEPQVTDISGPVYAFTGEANPVAVAASMARLSRNPHDLRKILVSEFGVDPEDAEQLIQRVVTAYGDDSVAQLLCIPLAVEDASNLLTKQLEWPRLLSYLEQSTRYIYFDQRGDDGRYRYHIPAGLDPEVEEEYVSVMDQMFDTYSELVRELTDYVRSNNPRPDKDQDPAGHAGWVGATRAQACDAVRTLLPAATTSTVGIVGSAQGIANLVKHLLSQPLEEMQETGWRILEQVRKVAPVFFERVDRVDRDLLDVENRVAVRRAFSEFHEGMLVHGHQNLAPVTLVDYWPHDETDLVARMLYATGLTTDGCSMTVLANTIRGWSESDKIQVMKMYFGNRHNRRIKPGRAIEKAHFEWELIGDYGTFRDLQRHRMVDAMEWQPLTPFYGYDVPDLIKEAGLAQKFKTCMNLSGNLYRYMLNGGFVYEAQYAVCMGYKMRYSFITNLRELFHLLELRTSPQGHPGYRKLCNLMYEELARVYPVSAAAMLFVNRSDNLEELTRMSSERGTAKKLQDLGIEIQD
ncbi:MAG: hypothetical protein QG675_146 [Patescibacteria group bacterium]|jgi:thymidylate synthase ThyX|nr:hypothetical protein [Patescibacteria group bacterium]